MSKGEENQLKEINFLGQVFLDKTNKLVTRAKEAERKAKESEKRAIKVKQKTQELMNRIIPREILSELSNDVSIKPQHYDNATICLSSIVNYDAMVSNTDAIQVFNFCVWYCKFLIVYIILNYYKLQNECYNSFLKSKIKFALCKRKMIYIWPNNFLYKDGFYTYPEFYLCGRVS